MYAIVREGDGRFYASVVFGRYKVDNAWVWIVLNREKTALIRLPALQPGIRFLRPMLLVVDADTTDWRLESENRQSVAFLPTEDMLSKIDAGDVSEEWIDRCIAMDAAYHYSAVQEVRTEADVRNLMVVSGSFHDAYIADQAMGEDSLYILLDGIWGCKMEIWFEGDVDFDVSSRDPEMHDPYWFGGSVVMKDGFVYLIDDEDTTPENLQDGYCWFKARSMKYRVIPD